MAYIMTTAKALTLVWTLEVGAPALCPGQVEGWDDEELNCEVLAIAPKAGVVVLVPRAVAP